MAIQISHFVVSRSLLVAFLVCPLVAHAEAGSKLEKFETDATRSRDVIETPPKPPADAYPPATYHTPVDEDSTADKDNDSFAMAVIEVISLVIAAGGDYSWHRVSATPAGHPTDRTNEMEATPRLLGEGVIPFARLDASYHRVGSRIHASDSRAEIGYGPVGFEFRTMRYTETDPDAELELKQYHVLYRMSTEDYAEIDIGFGGLELSGTGDNSGNSFTLPILIHPSPRFGIEVRPSWANINGTSISNHELAISTGGRFWAIRGGYHWLESPDERLSGPFLGISLRL